MILDLSLSLSLFPQICLIGQSRNYPITAESAVDARRQQFILSRCTKPHPDHTPKTPPNKGSWDDSSDGAWVETFKPRPPVEAVKNCSLVDKSVQEDIVATVTDAILKSTPREWIKLSDGREWNRGGMGMSLYWYGNESVLVWE